MADTLKEIFAFLLLMEHMQGGPTEADTSMTHSVLKQLRKIRMII